MKRLSILMGPAIIVAAMAFGAPAPATAATNCGFVKRQFTDGGAIVNVTKGSLKCANAKSLMRAYWGKRVDAFASTVRFRHVGISWTCRPTTSTFPYRWLCTGGRGGKFRVTAKE